MSILKLGSADIPTDHSHTYATEDLILQISQRVDHTTSILTSTFSHSGWHRPDPQSPITHTTSWNLYAALSAAELKALFSDRKIPDTDDKAEIAKCITGFDPLLPPPDASSKQVLTVKYMNEIDTDSLRLLAKRMKVTGALNSMTKKDLIHHLKTSARIDNLHSTISSQDVRPEKNLENRAVLARGMPSASHTVTDFFGEHYGSIDQFNREFFCVFKASGQNHYKTLLALQLVSSCVLNSYAIYSEHTACAPNPHPSRESQLAKAKRHGKCLDFVLDLVEEILDEFGEKKKSSK